MKLQSKTRNTVYWKCLQELWNSINLKASSEMTDTGETARLPSCLSWTVDALSSVQSLNCVQLFWPHRPQYARPPCPSPTPRVYSNSSPLSWWRHPTISSSVVPFSSYPQSLSASGSFQMCQLFTSGGQSIGVSALTSVLPVNTWDWSPLGCTGWTPLQSKGLSRVFTNTIAQKYQFFCAQLSL